MDAVSLQTSLCPATKPSLYTKQPLFQRPEIRWPEATLLFLPVAGLRIRSDCQLFQTPRLKSLPVCRPISGLTDPAVCDSLSFPDKPVNYLVSSQTDSALCPVWCTTQRLYLLCLFVVGWALSGPCRGHTNASADMAGQYEHPCWAHHLTWRNRLLYRPAALMQAVVFSCYYVKSREKQGGVGLK